MELQLLRTYHADGQGTNGELHHEGQKICSTIELPWRDNKNNISCIPEGSYLLLAREAHRRITHLVVFGVPGRSFIFLHPAKNALTELRGCIAPVMEITGPGKGEQAEAALDKLMQLVSGPLKRHEAVWLHISEQPITQAEPVSTPAPVISSSKKVKTCKRKKAA
jgi:hypothetical protein